MTDIRVGEFYEDQVVVTRPGDIFNRCHFYGECVFDGNAGVTLHDCVIDAPSLRSLEVGSRNCVSSCLVCVPDGHPGFIFRSGPQG